MNNGTRGGVVHLKVPGSRTGDESPSFSAPCSRRHTHAGGTPAPALHHTHDATMACVCEHARSTSDKQTRSCPAANTSIICNGRWNYIVKVCPNVPHSAHPARESTARQCPGTNVSEGYYEGSEAPRGVEGSYRAQQQRQQHRLPQL